MLPETNISKKKKVFLNFEALAASFQPSPKTACECLAVPRPERKWHLVNVKKPDAVEYDVI